MREERKGHFERQWNWRSQACVRGYQSTAVAMNEWRLIRVSRMEERKKEILYTGVCTVKAKEGRKEGVWTGDVDKIGSFGNRSIWKEWAKGKELIKSGYTTNKKEKGLGKESSNPPPSLSLFLEEFNLVLTKLANELVTWKRWWWVDRKPKSDAHRNWRCKGRKKDGFYRKSRLQNVIYT